MFRRMTVLIYGANGYTGRLIADQAIARGLRPILAGRDRPAISAAAAALGVDHRVFSLDDPAAMRRGLDDVTLVIHSAGPFSRTSAPMVDACIARGVHYLDITGEIGVFESIAARDAEARAAGVMLLPGVGFDVVPSDCLAAHLVRRLPTATRLALAFAADGGISRGTATTMIENAGRGGTVRRGGTLESVPAAWRTRQVDFGAGPVDVTTIPWGDVSTAFHSTGVGNIEVYTAMPRLARAFMIATRYLGPVLASRAVQRTLIGLVRRRAPGPGSATRAHAVSKLWGEATDRSGRRVVARLTTPQSYALTALTAVAAAEKVFGGNVYPGVQTPSRAFGADFILEIPGVRREDVE
jgi:short subunit dehydrogenase-like uncharacterized protein